MDRLERLINLSAALLAAERPLTRVELRVRVPGYAAEDESFRRAFERDKDALRSMGIPVAVEPLDSRNPDSPEGYRVRREQYELPDPRLEPDELAALHLAVSAVRLEGTAATEAIWKLGGAPDVAEPAARVALEGSEHLPALFACVSERRAVRFTYRAEGRTVDPWLLAFRNGRWYLSGRDHTRDDERQFRLDRMSGPKPVGPPAAFERPTGPGGPPPRPWAMGDEDPVDARFVVDAAQAPWARTVVGNEAIATERSDGAVEFTVHVTNRAQFRDLVLGFLERGEILDPPELRADLVIWLKAIA